MEALPGPARAALDRLREGNRRFVAGVRSVEALQSRERLTRLAAAQEPFAVVLGCSDSRAPAEILFDQGLGDLFVIRVAGNIVAPSQVGSVEFAVARFGTPLVVVLGHTRCGAIEATVDAAEASPPLRSIVDRIRPAVAPLLRTAAATDREELLREAARANVRVSVDHLRHGSRILEEAAAEGRLAVVGALFHLDSGEVEFLER
jgi:carbonic anhydrase